MSRTSQPITDPNDPHYDPNKDPLFMDPPKPVKGSLADTGEPKVYYAGTDKTAQEWIDLNGTNPDGSPRTEPVPDTPSCPPVSPQDGPFGTTTIPPGCSAPLSQECADFYNKQYGYAAAKTKT